MKAKSTFNKTWRDQTSKTLPRSNRSWKINKNSIKNSPTMTLKMEVRVRSFSAMIKQITGQRIRSSQTKIWEVHKRKDGKTPNLNEIRGIAITGIMQTSKAGPNVFVSHWSSFGSRVCDWLWHHCYIISFILKLLMI